MNYAFLSLSRILMDRVVLVFVWTVIVYVILCSGTSSDMNCDSVRYLYRSKGLKDSDVPKDPLPGEHLRVCAQGLTCCTQEMEHQMGTRSKKLFEKVVKDILSRLASIVRTRAQRFDDFFKKLLATSKRDFHEMFKRTYGILYEQNSYVFTDLFEELERYYSTGQVDLTEAMDNFFSTLYQKMFTVLNSQYHFDDRYLGCVGEHMKELEPFGDVSNKLSIQLKRSFIATRTFSQALQVAGNVVLGMTKISPSSDCIHAITKMMGCQVCQDIPDIKACSNYCIHVMKGCLSYHVQLDTDWNNFVDALDKVTDRLLGPFNIEMVVEPIDLKISEAIMNFQEKGAEVSQRIFTGCGKPVLGKRKRRDVMELEFPPLEFSKPGDGQNAVDNNGPLLDKLLKDIRSKVKETKLFWSRLPYHVCNDEQVVASPETEDDSCWNGAVKARYPAAQVMADKLEAQRSSGEVGHNSNPSNTIFNEQLFALRSISNKLKNAYNGIDVDWIDNEEMSSYGSGSGSGDGIDTTEDSDDEDSSTEGSGGFEIHRQEVVPPVEKPAGPKVHHPVQPSNKPTDRIITTDYGPKNTSSNTNTIVPHKISVTRAVASYLLPIVVMWFGGILSDYF